MDALNNLSQSIGELINSMKDEKKDESKAGKSLKSGFFNNKITKNINIIKKDVLSIKSDVKAIAKNQKNILNLLQKKKSDNDTIDKMSNDKKKTANIKSGVGTIILIAGAVLAIGKAFGLVGKIDFASVMALSIALPLLAFAFEKIASIKSLNPISVGTTLLVLMGISAAIVGSSFILSAIQPISLTQLASIFVIGAALGIATMLLTPILTSSSFSKIKPVQMLTLPLVLMGIAAAMVGASFIFQSFQPISASVLGSIALAGISFGLAFTAIAVTIAFIGYVVSKIGLGNFILGGIGLVVASGAFAASSLLVAYGNYNTSIPLGFALSFGITMALLAIPVAILGSIGLPIVIMGSLGLVILAAAFAFATQMLSFANFDAMKSMADVITYAIGSLLQNVVPYLMPIGAALANFIALIEPPITAFVQGTFPLLINLVKTILELLMPAIMLIVNGLMQALPLVLGIINSVVDTFASILPNLAKVFDSIGGIVEKVGNAISSVINSISSGIVNIITSVTDAILKLNELSLGDMVGIGTGLSAIAVGFGAIALSLAGSSIANLLGGDTVIDKVLQIGSSAKNIILAGKGIEYLSNALNKLSDFDSDGAKKVNKAIESINSASLSELAKNSGMVVTLSPSDLKTLMNEDSSDIELIPTNTDTSAQTVQTTNSSPSVNNTEYLLSQLISTQQVTNSLLDNIVKNTNNFGKIYGEMKKNKTVKTNNDKK